MFQMSKDVSKEQIYETKAFGKYRAEQSGQRACANHMRYVLQLEIPLTLKIEFKFKLVQFCAIFSN